MSQYRNTFDILDEILAKAGEPTNGNSPFETTALTYANRAHAEIIGGASIFNLEVAEPWVWARSRYPMVLELQPAVSDTASFVSASTSFTFGNAPTTSLEGWHIQASGKSTVYKITQHSAASTSAQLDSSFVDAGGSQGFRAFKLDYEVVPTYLYIDNYNDRIDFQDGTAGTTHAAVLPHGSYSLQGFATQIATSMQSAGLNTTYAGSYDAVLRQFSITSNTTFAMLGATGANVRRSVLPTFGFDYLDATGSVGYTASYMPGRIARMIEPFKIFTGGTRQPFIHSSDPIRMQEDFPLHLTRERIPDRFIRLTEDKDGAVWVRFNGFPDQLTKVQIDWIPTPLDLQDNTASTVLLPRQDVETLIHVAAARLLHDKEDSKFSTISDLAKAGLQNMMKNNRLLLQRTGEWFAQIVPRQDYLHDERNRLKYGYTAGNN